MDPTKFKYSDPQTALSILHQLAGNWAIGDMDEGLGRRWWVDGTVEVDDAGRDLLQRLTQEG